MRTLTVTTFLTLDGVMQAPGGPDEDTTGKFAHGGWSVGYWDDVMAEHMKAALSRPFELLLGRTTYELFAAHWPRVTKDNADEAEAAGAALFNGVRKYVASRTLRRVEWSNSSLLVGDVAAAVAELKRTPGPEIQVHGSWGLVQTLLEHDLVDRYRLWIFPVVAGTGKRLFAHGAVPSSLRLDAVAGTPKGVVIATYERVATGIRCGTFALADE